MLMNLTTSLQNLEKLARNLITLKESVVKKQINSMFLADIKQSEISNTIELLKTKFSLDMKAGTTETRSKFESQSKLVRKILSQKKKRFYQNKLRRTA